VDLAYEVDLFLFDSGFDRFWKMTAGTVVAVLNPTIMPPRPGQADTGRFGLVINSDADTILEVGSARDLGFCRSVKRDGQPCHAWVNARRTEHCEFHTGEALRRAHGSRVELNGMDLGGGPSRSGKGSGGGGRWKSKAQDGGANGRGESKQINGASYDRESQSHFFVSGGAHRGAAALLDEERENGGADLAERKGALKRRIAQRERERDIARKLARAASRTARACRPPRLMLPSPAGPAARRPTTRAGRRGGSWMRRRSGSWFRGAKDPRSASAQSSGSGLSACCLQASRQPLAAAAEAEERQPETAAVWAGGRR
jgi:minichromosome maintenance protein 10